MMVFRRALATVVALVISATFAASGVAAQQAPQKKDEKKRSKQEQAEIETVVKLVDGVMTGAAPAPSDITMTLEPFFMKSQEQRTFVPFVLTVNNAPKTDAAMYVRVVNPAAMPDPKAKKIEYPWDDIHFIPAAELTGDSVKLSRVFMATADGNVWYYDDVTTVLADGFE